MGETQNILDKIRSNVENNSKNSGDRFAGIAALNKMEQEDMDKLNGRSFDDILNYTVHTAMSMPRKPAYATPLGVMSMAFDAIPGAIEYGTRKHMGDKQAGKHTLEAIKGSRPWEIGEDARLTGAMLTPIGTGAKGLSMLKSGKKAATFSMDMTKPVMRGNRLPLPQKQIATKGRVFHMGGRTTTDVIDKAPRRVHNIPGFNPDRGRGGIKTSDKLTEAYRGKVELPSQFRAVGEAGSKIIKKSSKINQQTPSNAKRYIDKMIEGKGSVKLKANKVDRFLQEQHLNGSLNPNQVRDLATSAANSFGTKYKHKPALPRVEHIVGIKNVKSAGIKAPKGMTDSAKQGVRKRAEISKAAQSIRNKKAGIIKAKATREEKLRNEFINNPITPESIAKEQKRWDETGKKLGVKRVEAPITPTPEKQMADNLDIKAEGIIDYKINQKIKKMNEQMEFNFNQIAKDNINPKTGKLYKRKTKKQNADNIINNPQTI